MAAGLAEAGTINLYSGPLTFLPFRLGRAVQQSLWYWSTCGDRW